MKWFWSDIRDALDARFCIWVALAILSCLMTFVFSISSMPLQAFFAALSCASITMSAVANRMQIK